MFILKYLRLRHWRLKIKTMLSCYNLTSLILVLFALHSSWTFLHTQSGIE